MRVIPRERRTAGGVLLPETLREESDRGLVVATGPGTLEQDVRHEVGVREGEVILFSPYAGSKVSVGGEDFLLVREPDILGVVDGAKVVEEVDDGVAAV